MLRLFRGMNGYLMVLLSAVLYGIEPSVLEYALARGMGETQAMIVIAGFTILLYGGLAVLRHERLRITGTEMRNLWTLGLFMGGTNLLLALSYERIPVGCSTVIHFMYPSLVCLAMAVFFRVRMTLVHGAAIVLSVTGLVFITGGMEGLAISGVLLAALSSVTYVIYIILMDRLPIHGIGDSVKMVYIALGILTVAVIGSLFGGSMQGLSDPVNLLCLLLSGIMFAVATAAFARGVEIVGATSASFFSLFEPMISMIVSTLIYHYQLTGKTILGCVLAILAVLCIAWADHRKERERNP